MTCVTYMWIGNYQKPITAVQRISAVPRNPAECPDVKGRTSGEATVVLVPQLFASGA